MMRKGVSPVVGVVLLIAIAVIAAVAVWYWVSPLTGKPKTSETTQKSISIERCYDDRNALDVRNTGGLTVPANTFFDIYYLDNGSRVVGSGTNCTSATNLVLNISSNLLAGQITKFYITCGANSTSITNVSISKGYFLLGKDFPAANFNC